MAVVSSIPTIPATAINIELAIYNLWMSQRYMAMYPNCYIDYRNEMDVLGVRKSLFCDEFEIKVSVSDFKADFKKSCFVETEPWLEHQDFIPCTYSYCRGCQGTGTNIDTGAACGYQPEPRTHHGKTVAKHEALANGEGTPNYFSFAVPYDLAEKIEVPEHAGLYGFKSGNLHEIKKPPRLHSRKLSEKMIAKLDRKMMYRYWSNRRFQLET